MDEAIKEKAKGINWFLDFIQTNLNDLPRGDRARLCYEFEEKIVDRKPITENESKETELLKLADDMDSRPYVPRKREVKDQPRTHIFSELPYPNDLDNYYAVLLEAQALIKFKILGCIEDFLLEKRPYSWGGDMDLIVSPDKGKVKLTFAPRTKDVDAAAFARFVSLLEGVPIEGFKRCAECKKVFFYLHNRKKDFCSQECAWRFLARKRRHSDPEGYRKYQRELMRKKYREKVKEKLGANVKIKERKPVAKKA